MEECQFIGEAVSEMRHNVKLSNYQKFCISDGFISNFLGEWRSSSYFLGEGPERNCLDICKGDEVFSIDTFKNLAQKAEILCLMGLGGVWKNLIPEIICPNDEGTTNLVHIDLKYIYRLRCLIDNTDSRVQNALSKLELLKNLESIFLYHCVHLEGTLFKSKISFFNLKKLTIEGCPMLTSLFELSTTQNLLLLESISIYNCKQLKSIVRDENKSKDSGDEIVDGRNDNNTILPMFPNLAYLDISDCPQLHFILPIAAAQNVSKLASIEIRRCNGLKYIFGPCQHKHEDEELLQ